MRRAEMRRAEMRRAQRRREQGSRAQSAGDGLPRPRGPFGARRFRADEDGLTTVEYIIILVLIATTGIAMWRQFGEQVEFQIRSATTEINSLN